MKSSVESKAKNVSIPKELLDDMWYEGSQKGLQCIARYYGGEIADYIDSFYTNKPQGPKE